MAISRYRFSLLVQINVRMNYIDSESEAYVSFFIQKKLSQECFEIIICVELHVLTIYYTSEQEAAMGDFGTD